MGDGKGRNGNLIPIKKGQALNPGGRPRGYKEFAARAREMSMEGLEAVYKIATAKTTHPQIKLMAWRLIFERGFGKPTMAISLQAKSEVQFVLRLPEVITSAKDWEKTIEHERLGLPQPDLPADLLEDD